MLVLYLQARQEPLQVIHGKLPPLLVQIRQGWKHSSLLLHNDTQHNDTQYNDTQHNNTRHKDIQHNQTQNNNTQLNDTRYNDIHHNHTQYTEWKCDTKRDDT